MTSKIVALHIINIFVWVNGLFCLINYWKRVPRYMAALYFSSFVKHGSKTHRVCIDLNNENHISSSFPTLYIKFGANWYFSYILKYEFANWFPIPKYPIPFSQNRSLCQISRFYPHILNDTKILYTFILFVLVLQKYLIFSSILHNIKDHHSKFQIVNFIPKFDTSYSFSNFFKIYFQIHDGMTTPLHKLSS